MSHAAAGGACRVSARLTPAAMVISESENSQLIRFAAATTVL